MYTQEIISDEIRCHKIMSEMEEGYQQKNESLFISVIESESSLVLRVHAVCILATLGTHRSIPILSDIVINDPDPLVRHEAAFSLGQIGDKSAESILIRALQSDSEAIVRHESAAALGSIGRESSRLALEESLKDQDILVVNSARASLFNINFLLQSRSMGSARERAPRP